MKKDNIKIYIPPNIHRIIKRKAQMNHRSMGSIIRQALNNFLLPTLSKTKYEDAFRVIDNIFDGDAKHGIMFLDVLKQSLGLDYKECLHACVLAQEILRRYNINLRFVNCDRVAVKYEILNPEPFFRLRQRYERMKKKWGSELDPGFL